MRTCLVQVEVPDATARAARRPAPPHRAM